MPRVRKKKQPPGEDVTLEATSPWRTLVGGMRTRVHAPLPLVKVVGVSASGKSTLVRGLRAAGYDARPVSQEHSHVPDLWQQFGAPQVLIHLTVDLASQRQRRPDVVWDAAWRDTEIERLRHAHNHANLHIDTSTMTAEQVLRVALLFLQHERVRHADGPLPPVAPTGSPHQTSATPRDS